MSGLINKDPMTVWEIIDKSINFIFKNFLWIALLGFFITLPEFFFKTQIKSYESIAFGLLLSLISIILVPINLGMVTILLGEHFNGRSMPLVQGFKISIKKWIPLALLMLLVTLVVGLGFILLIIPGIIALCATACAVPAMMFEDLGPMKSFTRSWDLTKKHRLRIFASLLLYLLITIITSAAAAIIMHMPIYPFYKIVFATLIHAPVQALGMAIVTLLYFDLRIRKEAIDLEEEIT